MDSPHYIRQMHYPDPVYGVPPIGGYLSNVKQIAELAFLSLFLLLFFAVVVHSFIYGNNTPQDDDDRRRQMRRRGTTTTGRPIFYRDYGTRYSSRYY